MKTLYNFIGVTITTDVNKTIVMERVCHTGLPHNVHRDIDGDFIMNNFVHDG